MADTLVRALALAGLLCSSFGCGALDTARAQLAELSRPFPALPAQLDAPRSHAILLLDVDLDSAVQEFRVEGAEVARDDGVAARAGQCNESLVALFHTEEGLVLFPDLEPGRYHLVKAKGWTKNGPMFAHAAEAEPTTVEIAAGEVRYLHVAGHQKMFSSTFEWQRVTEPGRAHDALIWLAKRYPDSSWTQTIYYRAQAP